LCDVEVVSRKMEVADRDAGGGAALAIRSIMGKVSP
jgi:hypothetical protein